jgi:hypothetical protein
MACIRETKTERPGFIAETGPLVVLTTRAKKEQAARHSAVPHLAAPVAAIDEQPA